MNSDNNKSPEEKPEDLIKILELQLSLARLRRKEKPDNRYGALIICTSILMAGMLGAYILVRFQALKREEIRQYQLEVSPR